MCQSESATNWKAFDYYRRLGRVKIYLECNISEDFPVVAAARIAGLNSKYFSTFFHSKVGVRFGEWVHFVRIERAKTILETTNRSITDVAYSVGYRDLRTFERAFKRHNALTAWEYKQRVRPSGKRVDH